MNNDIPDLTSFHGRRTGFAATSLACVAGVAYRSSREPGCGYRFSSGMGRPEEISGLTMGVVVRVPFEEDREGGTY
jgi:hypothetical protein